MKRQTELEAFRATRQSKPPDKPKLVRFARKLDLVNLACLAGLRVVRYEIVGIPVSLTL